MNQKLLLFSTAAIAALSSSAHAQGLLSIGHSMDIDFDRKIPFVVTAGATLGWDSNTNLSSNNEEDSLYAQANVGVSYNTGDRRTSFRYYANYSPLYYFDPAPGVDDFQHNVRLGLDYRRRINERLTITDNFYLAYEIEPDYNVGAAVARRNDQYLYGYNSLAASYAWNRRFSTVTSWTISVMDYENNVADAQDNLVNIFGNEFRYALSRTTTLAGTYRFAITDYDGANDYDSHYLLAGVDHRFNPRLTASFRAGVEMRDRDIGGSSTEPYFEGALTYYVSRRTNLRWYSRYSMSEFDAGNDSTSFATGLSADHRINSRLSVNAGLHYHKRDYGSGTFGGEDVFSFSCGFDYSLYRNISLNGGYSVTSSDRDGTAGGFSGDYDRHHLQLGIGARF
jgi:Putative beta-barrel porin 2